MSDALHVFSNRLGGVSTGSFAEANLSLRVGDNPAAVHCNRRRLLSAMGLQSYSFVTTRQVHGARVVRVGTTTGMMRPGVSSYVEADGMVTTQAGLALFVGTADCLPVVLVSPTAVGVLHVGWRGLVAGIVESGVEAMNEAGAHSHEMRAHLGPSISACHFIVGEDLRQRVAHLYAAAAAWTHAGEPALDLTGATVDILASRGIHDVLASTTCTFESPHHFSARRDRLTGCQGAVVAMH